MIHLKSRKKNDVLDGITIIKLSIYVFNWEEI